MSDPVPFVLKKLRGNPGCRKMHPEPMPAREAQCPEPPAYLSRHGAEEWHRVAPELYALGLLTRLDVSCLCVYVESYSRWRTALEAVQRLAASDPQTHALLTADKDGTQRRHPLVAIVRGAADDMLASAREFGLTPLARARLAGVWQQPNVKDEFDGLIPKG